MEQNAIQLNNKILGKISYKILGLNEAVADIELQMSKQLFKSLCDEKKRKSALILAIDRSGSMQGRNISTVRSSSDRFA